MGRLVLGLLVCAVVEALQEITPGAQWNLRGDEYEGIEWLDKSKQKPSKAQVEAEIAACRTRKSLEETQKRQAVLDAKDAAMKPEDRLDALIKALDLR